MAWGNPYRPTTLNGQIRKRFGASGIGNRALGDREILRNSSDVDRRRIAQRQTGERYRDPQTGKKHIPVPKGARNLGKSLLHIDTIATAQSEGLAQIGDVGYASSSVPAKRPWPRAELEYQTKDHLVKIAASEGIELARRWGKGKMIDTLDAELTKKYKEV